MSEATLSVILAASLVWAGVMFGLWRGERGRRKDAQRREGIIRVDAPKRASVKKPGPQVPNQTRKELADAPDRFVRETMAETGCTREEAELEWNTLVAKSFSESTGAPDR